MIFGFMSSSSTASKQRDESGRWCSWIYVGGTVAVGVGFPHSLFEYLNPKGATSHPNPLVVSLLKEHDVMSWHQ